MALLLLACCVPRCAAWGAQGHMTTAALGERHLSEGAAAAAAADLATFKTLYPTESQFVTAADWCAPPMPPHGVRRSERCALDPVSRQTRC